MKLNNSDPQSNVFVFESADDLAKAAAKRFVEYATAAIEQSGRFCVALAGGNTPRRLYEALASNPFRKSIDWSRVQIFFGDERCVPPDDPQSNFRMVNESLLTKVNVPDSNVHRMKGELDPAEAASTYEAELKSIFRESPKFDLILLGLGEDGHTASLFPGSDVLNEQSRWVIATKHPVSGQDRITLTLPLINRAAHIVFLLTGKEKAAVLREVIRNEPTAQKPASLIKPVDGSLEWLVDKDAAFCL